MTDHKTVHHLAAADLVLGTANFTHHHDLLHHHVFGPPALDGGEGEAPPKRRQRRRPTLIGVAKQAAKAAITVARYELKPDGTVIVHTGEADTGKQPGNELDEWLETRRAN